MRGAYGKSKGLHGNQKMTYVNHKSHMEKTRAVKNKKHMGRSGLKALLI